jgi:hypothetical protein
MLWAGHGNVNEEKESGGGEEETGVKGKQAGEKCQCEAERGSRYRIGTGETGGGSCYFDK